MMFVIILFVCLMPYSAFSEQSGFCLEGEWYTGSYYTNNFDTACINEEGDYIISHFPDEYIVHMDGTIESSEEKVSIVGLADNAVLIYNIHYDMWSKQDVLSGYLLFGSGENITCYSISNAILVLLLNGKAIRNDGNASVEYLLSGNQFFMTDGTDTYSRGTYRIIGNDLFLYDINTAPSIWTNGDYEINYGTPVMFFVRSSVVQ